jgi:hypothetical protein
MGQTGHSENTLYYGDNLDILREYVPDESVDLIYLDPPFNSNRNYNVLFKDEGGKESEAQLEVFGDTWHWGEAAEQTYYELWTMAPDEVSKAIAALRQLVGTNQVMAYLVMMAVRLVELHRVLKPTGSLYLHCDPTSSHYLKIVVDAILARRTFATRLSGKGLRAIATQAGTGVFTTPSSIMQRGQFDLEQDISSLRPGLCRTVLPLPRPRWSALDVRQFECFRPLWRGYDYEWKE